MNRKSDVQCVCVTIFAVCSMIFYTKLVKLRIIEKASDEAAKNGKEFSCEL